MTKFIPVLALFAALSLAACDDDRETLVIQPPPQQSVVPEDNSPNTVVVPQSDPDVKVCPEGTTTC